MPLAHLAAVAGAALAFFTGNGEEEPFAVRSIAADGTGDRLLLGASGRFGGGASDPRWSPDGRTLLVARYFRREDSGSRAALWTMSADGKPLRKVPLGARRVYLHGYDWAPDGRRVVVALSRSAPGLPGRPAFPRIVTVRLDGSRRRAIGRGFEPAWSPDGERIAFARRRSGPERWDERIYAMRRDGGGVRRLTASTTDSAPSFTADGRVLFARSRDDVRQDEWRTVAVDGTGDTLLVAHPRRPDRVFCAPQAVPDGIAAIAVQRDAEGATLGARMTLTAPDGTSEQDLFAFPPHFIDRGAACGFSWRPADGD